MYGHGSNFSAPRYRESTESGRPFRLDSDRPKSSPSVHVGHDLYDTLGYSQTHYAPSVASGATKGDAFYPAWSSAPSGAIHGTFNALGALDFHSSSQEVFRSTGPPPDPQPPSPAVAHSHKEAFSTAGAGQYPSGGGGRVEERFHTKEPATSSGGTDGNEPVVLCGGHVQEHDDKNRGLAGAKKGHVLEDGGVVHPRAEHQPPAATTRAAHCEHAGCGRTPQYGRNVKDDRLSLCQAHKKKGMYTIRDGVLMIATRDGTAFREAASDPTVSIDKDAITTVPERATESIQTSRKAAQLFVAPTAAASARRQQTKPQRVNITKVLSRKICEIPGCLVQPSYGAAGTSRARFCSRHKEKDHISLKNRPCLFPGCNTRPHYGLSGARAVFCVTHKKDRMVHLLKESKNLKKKEANRKHSEHCDAEKRGRSAKNPTHDEDKKEGETKEVDQKKRKGEVAAASRRGKRRKTTTGNLPQTAGSSPPSRATAGPGLAPSDEMRLLREARESAQAAAAANSSGRRVRAPSRKLLEASGRMVGESAQWMTKKKREEEARTKRERKEQNIAAAAVGLKIGEVIESSTIALPRGRNVRSEGSVSVGALSGGEAARSKVSWQKLTPEEMLRAAGKQPDFGGVKLDLLGGKRATAAEANVVIVGKQEERAPVAAAAAAESGNVSEGRRKEVAPAGEPTARQGSNAVEEVASESGPKRSGKGHGGGQSEGERSAAKAKCEFESCSKTATFGVNVVRYCKMHRIFGMHRIVGRS